MIQLFKALPEVTMPSYGNDTFSIHQSNQPIGLSIETLVSGERIEEVLLVASGEIRTGQTGTRMAAVHVQFARWIL